MKVRAIRLREVGCFAKPTVVEGLTGGLDVLAQPNEAGKSTLFRALRAALLEKHSSKREELRDLRPYDGGAPLIEIDFETGKGGFRLRKQFLSAAMAELKDLKSGAMVARGSDADDRALELIGAVGGEKDPFGLFWVAQGESLGNVEPGNADAKALSDVIESEVKTVTGGRRARAVLDEARKARETFVTGKQGRPKGDYAAAIERSKALTDEVAKAEAEVAAAEGLLRRLSSLRMRRAALAEPGEEADRKEAVILAREALGKARSAHERWQAAEQALKLAVAERDAAALALADHDRHVAELSRLEDDVAKCSDLLDEKRKAAAAARADAVASEEALSEARGHAAGIEEMIRRIRIEERRAAALAERSALEQRLTQANEATAALALATKSVSCNCATPEALARIERLTRDVEVLRARLAAGAPSLSIAYLPGAEGRISVDGQPLRAGTSLKVTASLELKLDKIGILTVEPGTDVKTGEDRDRLRALEQELGSALSEIGATDPAEAYRLKAERDIAESSRRLAAEKLTIIAPEGMEVLKRRFQTLPEQETEEGPPLPDLEKTEVELAEARRTVSNLEAARTRLASNVAAIDVLTAGETAKLRALRDQRDARAQTLPPPADRETYGAGLAERLAHHEARVAEALAVAETARGDMGGATDTAPFEMRLKRAEEAQRNARDDLARCEREIAGIDGELKALFKAGTGERLEELRGQLEASRARIEGFRREVAELDLLIAVLEQAAKEAQDTFFRPVFERLTPMLQQVFPSAEMEFGKDLRPQRLIRGTQPEELRYLSGGTREQIAVLVRLAFAGLMADGRKPTPVILDDALVFAGDERLGPLFNVLHMAAARHQVIVLTCHARAFAPLGGNRIAIETRDFV
ncbi:MAG: hypothetical protein AB7S41_05765 [Parvibaculaceae bacterium]